MNQRRCKNPYCTKGWFTPKRRDHIYCSSKCRNAVNNKMYERKNRLYQQIGKFLQEQDEILESIHAEYWDREIRGVNLQHKVYH